jgi:hypothetical protein
MITSLLYLDKVVFLCLHNIFVIIHVFSVIVNVIILLTHCYNILHIPSLTTESTANAQRDQHKKCIGLLIYSFGYGEKLMEESILHLPCERLTSMSATTKLPHLIVGRSLLFLLVNRKNYYNEDNKKHLPCVNMTSLSFFLTQQSFPSSPCRYSFHLYRPSPL